MILLLPTKEYWFSKIHRRLEEIADHSTFLTFQEIKYALIGELMHIETINSSDDIYLFKRKFREPLGAKLLEIDRMYGTEFFINSYFYSKDTLERINKSDLYHEFEKEYDCLVKEATNRLR